MNEHSIKAWEFDTEGNRGVTCTCCKTFKVESNYSQRKTAKLGIRGECKSCSSIKKDSWVKTKVGVIQTIWDSQKSSCKTRSMEQPKYNKDWFFDWCLSQDKFHTLFATWELNSYIKSLKPSVDRLNNLETYTKENIQLLTWGENKKLADKALREGNSTFEYKGVTQYSLEGNKIKEFLSAKVAQRELGIDSRNIQANCKGRRNQAGGFVWKFTTK